MSDDIEIEKRLRSIEQKTEENSKILRSIKRKQILSFWFGIVKIAIFIGLFYYAYSFAEPFLIQIKDMYHSIQGLSEQTESFKGFDLFEYIKQASAQ